MMSSLSYVNGTICYFDKTANNDLKGPACALPSFSISPESPIPMDGLAKDSLTVTHCASHEAGKELIKSGRYMSFCTIL